MQSQLMKILVASNVLLWICFVWLWQYVPSQSTSGSEWNSSRESTLAVDPKTGESSYHKNQVKNTIVKNSGALQKCYQDYLKSRPKVKMGNIKIDWQILSDGKPVKVERIVNQLGEKESAVNLETCLVDSIRAWEFPPPPVSRPVYVAHSFYFGEKATDPPEMINVK